MVLNNPRKLLPDHVIELTLKNQVEINLLGQKEQELIVFLRHHLKNDHLILKPIINADAQQSKPYTNAEIFNEMASKNPTLIKLRDELGLDTDY